MLRLETARLTLRELGRDDAPFIVELLNDAGFVRYIGDRGVRTLAQAQDYIANGPVRSYRDFGFGLLLMQAKSDGKSLGMCGLVQRDYLPDPDIGFAVLPQYRALGLCSEAARLVLTHATDTLRLKRIGAIVQPDNEASLAVLRKLDFAVDRAFKRSADEPEVLLLARFL
jgi:RimJ/RimL family protein N-acetyltransferase